MPDAVGLTKRFGFLQLPLREGGGRRRGREDIPAQRLSRRILLNFSDQEAALVLDNENEYTMLLNTGWEEFGGQEKKVVSDHAPTVLAPFSGVLLRRMDRD